MKDYEGVIVNKIEDGIWEAWDEFVRLFIITDGDETILVDTAFGKCIHEIIADLGVPEPTRILLTHDHFDHTTGCQFFPDATFLMHENSVPEFRKNYPDFKVETVGEGDHVKVGNLDFQILYTPGHTPGHIYIQEANRKWIFTGDSIAQETGIYMVAPTCSFPDLISALNRAKELPASEYTIMCCHGPLNPPADIIDEIIACAEGVMAGSIVPKPAEGDDPAPTYMYKRAWIFH